ncbi:hypothetical protein ACLM5J_03895 [Nocardioides sp. Bht2]|uniref:hypothetical protein n=1 Tax=Nocardioides sp. Bht2 TaxID=3392297 RepID=UPI0039B40790
MTAELEWADGAYDAALHLLDRQIVDVDGLAVAKVDDVELTPDGDDLVVTGLLTGPAALIPRLGGRAGGWLLRHYGAVKVTQAHPTDPSVVDIAQVATVTSQVALSVARRGLLRPRDDRAQRHRVGQLMTSTVRLPDGLHAGRVLDVRLRLQPGNGALAVAGLVVDRHNIGGLLGYDRAKVDGPIMVSALLRRLHRRARFVPIEHAVIDWESRELTVDLVRHGEPLTPAR